MINFIKRLSGVGKKLKMQRDDDQNMGIRSDVPHELMESLPVLPVGPKA